MRVDRVLLKYSNLTKYRFEKLEKILKLFNTLEILTYLVIGEISMLDICFSISIIVLQNLPFFVHAPTLELSSAQNKSLWIQSYLTKPGFASERTRISWRCVSGEQLLIDPYKYKYRGAAIILVFTNYQYNSIKTVAWIFTSKTISHRR